MSLEIRSYSIKAVNEKILLPKFMPSTAWFSNLRSELSYEEWKVVQQKTFELSGYVCDICGGRGDKHPVECHEEWDFDDANLVQRLVRTVSLCPDCHTATHFGLARVRGVDRIALQHIMKVNCWSINTAVDNLKIQSALGESRSKHQWILDARWLLDFIELSEKTRNKILEHAKGLLDRTIKDWQMEIVKGGSIKTINADELFMVIAKEINNKNYVSGMRNYTNEVDCGTYKYRDNELVCKWSGFDANKNKISFCTINYSLIDKIIANVLNKEEIKINELTLNVVSNKVNDFIIKMFVD